MAAQAHKDIRILFTVGGRHYEAVGFLREGEPYCLGEEMLRRTANENGGAIKGEAFLREHRAELPSELTPYWLVTDERAPAHPRNVSYFGWLGGRWCQLWRWLGHHWSGYCLVVRRLP